MLPTLLDTDMLTEFLKQRNANVVQHATDYLQLHGQFAFSAMTRFEILRGYLEKNATLQLTRFATFCRHSWIFPVNDAVLDRAAELWKVTRQTGQPHGDADLIIAATALESGRVLATGNTSHFNWIKGLTIQDWRVV